MFVSGLVAAPTICETGFDALDIITIQVISVILDAQTIVSLDDHTRPDYLRHGSFWMFVQTEMETFYTPLTVC